jgi:hypothetical protein
MNEKLAEKIIKLYKNPKFGFVNLDIFSKKLKEKGIYVSRQELEKILSPKDSYNLNKAVWKYFLSRKVIIYNVFEQLQTNLVYMDNLQRILTKDNDSIKYLLTVIDCFNKYA